MTAVLSWNIQNGLGSDGLLSLERIAETIFEMGEPDIICLQEVSVNMTLKDGSIDNQVQILSSLFDGYTQYFGKAVDTLASNPSQRAQFGNLILSRFPVYNVFYHPLPQPPEGPIKQMPRQMVEVVVQTPSAPLRVMTTHLEYHSALQRRAQVKRIMAIQSEVSALENDPPAAEASGPYTQVIRPGTCILCGDFNFLTGSKEYREITKAQTRQQSLLDAWPLVSQGLPHPPTCGVHDTLQWPQGPHCRDFIFVTPNLENSVINMTVNPTTNASDHQPLMLNLNM